VYLTPQLARVFEAGEKAADKAGDSFVTVERLLLALAIEKDSEAGRALSQAGVTPQALNAAIEALRKGRTADSAGAENAYDALKKYARDLTEAARSGKLDPVIGRDEEIRRTIQVLSRRTRNSTAARSLEFPTTGLSWLEQKGVAVTKRCAPNWRRRTST
jgi:ATP-dependent Clp protease ATP-binding subunit ClpB